MLAYVLVIAAPVVAAASTRLPSWPGRVAPLLLPALVFAYLLSLTPEVMGDGEVRTASVGWIPDLGIEFAFRIDGWSLLFALLISGVGVLVLVYSRAYMGDPGQRRTLEALLLLFMASMLVAVLADDLITLYAAWELTSVVSFVLIGFDHQRPEARAAAQQALIVTAAGGLAMLGGFIYLAVDADTSRISQLAEAGRLDTASTGVMLAFVAVLAGATTKSAQFPFHGWLPGAMAAPTPVSAYLHSATMVKLGIYLLGRMYPALGDVDLWVWMVPALGATTMVVGALLAVRERDLKRVLAYSTVSALGTMVLLLGVGGPGAQKAVVVFLLAHAGYKAALFLAAGAIEHGSGTRLWPELRGLRTRMPWTALATGVAAASVAGLPPTAGFLAKETLLEAGIDARFAIALTIAIVLSSALQVVVAGMVALRPFGGPATPSPATAHEVSPALWGPPLVLATLGLAGGGLLEWQPAPVKAAASAVAGSPLAVDLHLWPGLTLALLLSTTAIALGASGYVALNRLSALPWPLPSAERIYDGSIARLTAGGKLLTRGVQTGSLSQYLLLILLAAVVASGWMLVRHIALPSADGDFEAIEEVLLPAMVIVGGVAAAAARSRLQAVVSLGVVGFGVAAIFAIHGGPDLAMTQILMDVLTVVLLFLAFQLLPVASPSRRPVTHAVEVVVAGTVGLLMALLTLAVLTVPAARDVTAYFAAASVPEAHGRNVVNTILVDFRALDTAGEIAVLAAAAMGVFALLTQPRPASRSAHAQTRTTSLVLRTATRTLMALLFVFALFLLWRGHNEPGGGFIAGLVASVAVALYALAYGPGPARHLLRIEPARLMGLGLAIAVVSGVFGLLAGAEPMTGQWVTVAGLWLGTPLLFDLGVFAVVIGATVTVVLNLAEHQ